MDLVFTQINCDNVRIKREYQTVEDFYNDVESDDIDVAISLDDQIEELKIYGVDIKVTEYATVYGLIKHLN